MGNGLSPCASMPAAAADAPAAARLVYWGGRTRALPVSEDEEGEGERSGVLPCTAADVTAELLPADHVVCPADSFFVGLPVPVASPGERLLPGRTYFVLPRRLLSSPSPGGNGKAAVLTAATLASLSAAPGGRKTVQLAGPGQCPFEYVKGGEDGAAALIRVLPQFIEKVITCDGGNGHGDAAGRRGSGGKVAASATELCSTPELKRHYAQLVGAKGRPWSPGLETISERSKRRIFSSPARRLLSSQ